MDTLMDTDVLMIDDMGVEPLMENITIVQWFNLINERQLRGKGTVISTNLNVGRSCSAPLHRAHHIPPAGWKTVYAAAILGRRRKEEQGVIQLYISKKNFDAQKAERFFKERRVQVQVMDLKKHKLGERELQTMAKDVGMQGLLDREDKRAKEHPACYCNIDSVIMTAIQENPWLLKSPIVRSGQKCTIGYQPEIWESWLKADK